MAKGEWSVYAPRGLLGLSEVGDVEAFPHGDQVHLFHLTLPNCDVVQHVVSADGLAWRPLPAALHTGDPGECDDDQIWTMSVTERDGSFVMVYTALARAEDGTVQRTAVARSPDLIHWTKSARNPVAEADPRWYEADLSASGRVSWRDPKPILVDDTYYAVVCAREKDGPLLRRGCVGVLASKDLETWEVRPPLFAPRRFWDLECPQVFKIGGRYYLTAAIMEDRTQRYWVAPRFEGPYETPADGGILAPIGHYAGRVCPWQGADLFFCWHHPSERARVYGAPVDVDWTTTRNPSGKFVVAPLVLEPRPDGSLARRSFPGWTAYRQADPTDVQPMANSLFHGQAADAGAGWEVVATDGRMDVLASDEAVADVWVEGAFALAAGSGGVGFRLDDAGGGYFIEMTAGGTEVSLRKWLPVRNPRDSRSRFHVVELQRGRLHRPAPTGQAVPFRLLVVGPYIEWSLGDEVVLATLSAERAAGRIGCWAEGGS